MSAVEHLNAVRAAMAEAEHKAGRPAGSTALVAVSKTYDADVIRPVIGAGQRIFGENRVQEAQSKWPALKSETDGLALHLIGPLQSNKAADAIALFDVIETVDRDKIAAALAREAAHQQRRLRYFVQVNVGEEEQKAGIAPRETVAFVQRCRKEHGLDIVGLMAIPPVDENAGPYFALLARLASDAGVAELSMGMSGDFELAIAFGATSVRVGSAIFGART